MSEPITFDPLGTISVEFDGTTYTLRCPNFGHWTDFSQSWLDAVRAQQKQGPDLRAKFDLANERLELAKTDAQRKKAAKEANEAADEIREYRQKPLFEWQVLWMREVFEQLGDKPLPADEKTWPAWLGADPNLPMEIIQHWQAHPKASGENPK